ncbi:MAG: DoxX family protein [Actinomycetota bacterium]|nr:DoxX family protein [Actinomycetota bacterium]
MKLGRLVARTVIGGLFIGHGTQKLFGWFDGPGLEGTTGMMESLGLQPARENAIAAGVTETAGGTMILTGTLTPVAASGLIGTMITAIRTVHWKNGPWNSNGGFEFNLVMIAALLILAESGPGKCSVDRALGTEKTGPGSVVFALAGGALASALLIEQGRRLAAGSDDGAEESGSSDSGPGDSGPDETGAEPEPA